LDHNATTPIDPDVFKAMLPFLREEYGNPSSAHALGRRARDAVETARAEVAALIGAQQDEIVFTSGGTEANNIAIRGAVSARPNRPTIVTTAIEHPATEECCRQLETSRHRVVRVAPTADGRVEPDGVLKVLDRKTALVTVIHAQNEIGTLQPVDEIARLARSHGTLVHTDAAQSVGKIPVDVSALGIDLLSIAGHKLYAPKGVGALYIRRGVDLPPLLVGAGQERGRRPGTENVAAIVALGTACSIAERMLEHEQQRLADLSRDLLDRLKRAIPGLTAVGDPDARLPNTLTVLFPGAAGRDVLQACPRVLASTGSACHAGTDVPSPVLAALGIGRDLARGAVRLSLGRATKSEDVEIAASSLASAWRCMCVTLRGDKHAHRSRTNKGSQAARRAGGKTREAARGGRP
jgi:cysteine desulfurase